MPGFDGGMEWGGAAVDPDGIYYANVNEIPWIYQMIPTRGADGKPVSAGERAYKIHCSYCHGLDRKGDSASGFPALNQRQRSSREVSLGYFAILLAGFLLWISYGIAAGNVWLVVPNSIALLVGLTLVAVALRLRR